MLANPGYSTCALESASKASERATEVTLCCDVRVFGVEKKGQDHIRDTGCGPCWVKGGKLNVSKLMTELLSLHGYYGSMLG